jgi:hypothetical protein
MRPVPALRTTTRGGPDAAPILPDPATDPDTPSRPAFALHLRHGWWIASCPGCGHELGRSRDQEAAERAGERRRCPICRPERPDRHAQLAFLVAWIGANVDLNQEAS